MSHSVGYIVTQLLIHMMVPVLIHTRTNSQVEPEHLAIHGMIRLWIDVVVELMVHFVTYLFVNVANGLNDA